MEQLTPLTREEEVLNTLLQAANGEAVEDLNPEWRKEQWFQNILDAIKGNELTYDLISEWRREDWYQAFIDAIQEGGGGGSVPEYEGAYTVTPTEQTQTLATNGKQMTDDVTVNPIPSSYIVPTGTKQITANGTGIDVAAYADVDVNVPSVTPTGTISITQNGQVDVTQYATANVNVSGGGDWDEPASYDGDTMYLYIDAPYDGFSTSLYIVQKGNGGMFNWGDGSSDAIPKGTEDSAGVYTKHIYAQKGKYVISIRSANHDLVKAKRSQYDTSDQYNIFGNYEKSFELKKVRLPSNGSIFVSNVRLFYNASLLGVVYNMNSYDDYEYAHTMIERAELIALGNTIGQTFVWGCENLRYISVPQGITSISDYAFYDLPNIEEIHFLSSTPPTIGGSNAFYGVPTTCKIYVPTGSLSAYTSATNYPSASTYTYVEE
jgi:hypothetical protein